MADYDFASLNDKEFESLSVDVLSIHFGVHIERFKAGADCGVDGRFLTSHGDEIIIQCKHWVKSGLAALLRSIEKIEIVKVKKLNPKRYIFVTSLALSRANKRKIKDLFYPYLLRESDVFGNEDINDLLANHIDIERKHYKLWITSTNVLQTILNNAIIGRSKHKLEEIIDESNRYVITESHTHAMEKLERRHSIIITGSPGVGKTFLADQLCQFYAANQFELCYVENSLNEAENIYDEQKKQVFYFDDFLGRNFLLALNAHEDSHVINFIKRVEKDGKKRFILTSRSNILNQGKHLSDLFDIKGIKRNEYEVSIRSLTPLDKAKILYNHIWFSQLDDGYVDELYKEKRYLKIIEHKNFNPRIIAFITDNFRLPDVKSDGYWSYVEQTLANPKDIWKNVFEVQIDAESRHIAIAVVIHGQRINESALRSFYQRMLSDKLDFGSPKKFDTVIRLLCGALLNRNASQDYVYFELFDPSIADYVIADYLGNFDYLCEILFCLGTSESIDNVFGLYKSGLIEKQDCSKLVERLLIRLSEDESNQTIDEYKLRLLRLASETLSPDPSLRRYLGKLVEDAIGFSWRDFDEDSFEFIYWSMNLRIINPDDSRLLDFLSEWLEYGYKSFDQYVALSKILVLVEPFNKQFTGDFKASFIDFLSEDITEYAIIEGVLADAFGYESCDIDDIYVFVRKKLSDVAVGFADAEVEQIIDHCDIDAIIQSNIDAATEAAEFFESPRNTKDRSLTSAEAIDDLFDRS